MHKVLTKFLYSIFPSHQTFRPGSPFVQLRVLPVFRRKNRKQAFFAYSPEYFHPRSMIPRRMTYHSRFLLKQSKTFYKSMIFSGQTNRNRKKHFSVVPNPTRLGRATKTRVKTSLVPSRISRNKNVQNYYQEQRSAKLIFRSCKYWS